MPLSNCPARLPTLKKVPDNKVNSPCQSRQSRSRPVQSGKVLLAIINELTKGKTKKKGKTGKLKIKINKNVQIPTLTCNPC